MMDQICWGEKEPSCHPPSASPSPTGEDSWNQTAAAWVSRAARLRAGGGWAELQAVTKSLLLLVLGHSL